MLSMMEVVEREACLPAPLFVGTATIIKRMKAFPLRFIHIYL